MPTVEWEISRDGPENLSAKVYRSIADRIARGELQQGERLPSERVLCQHLGVSRVTLRHALSALLDDGLVSASAGRGWYVGSARVGEPPNALQSFTSMGAARGLVASSRVISTEVRPATLDEAEALETAPGAPVFELNRVRLLDEIPVALSHARLALARAPVLPEMDFSRVSLYSVLEESGVVPTRADFAVEAGEADDFQAELLELHPRGAVLITRERMYDQADRPIELARTVYRGDRYRFHATLIRPSATASDT